MKMGELKKLSETIYRNAYAAGNPPKPPEDYKEHSSYQMRLRNLIDDNWREIVGMFPWESMDV